MKKLAVLSIIPILCIILVAVAGCGTDKAEQERMAQLNERSCRDNMRTIESATYTYMAETTEWPDSVEDLYPSYIKEVPTCPDGGRYKLVKDSSGILEVVCPNGHTY